MTTHIHRMTRLLALCLLAAPLCASVAMGTEEVNAPIGAFDTGECDSCKNDDAVSDGCAPSELPGSTDDAIRLCVCEGDESCCTTAFDELCVVQALACGAQCPAPPPESDCCSASDVPGCRVPDVRACVCDIDPFCCANVFDDNCARLAQDACGALCVE